MYFCNWLRVVSLLLLKVTQLRGPTPTNTLAGQPIRLRVTCFYWCHSFQSPLIPSILSQTLHMISSPLCSETCKWELTFPFRDIDGISVTRLIEPALYCWILRLFPEPYIINNMVVIYHWSTDYTYEMNSKEYIETFLKLFIDIVKVLSRKSTEFTHTY
jgi:hypothetical protein